MPMTIRRRDGTREIKKPVELTGLFASGTIYG
jgi:hypothetical protein